MWTQFKPRRARKQHRNNDGSVCNSGKFSNENCGMLQLHLTSAELPTRGCGNAALDQRQPLQAFAHNKGAQPPLENQRAGADERGIDGAVGACCVAAEAEPINVNVDYCGSHTRDRGGVRPWCDRLEEIKQTAIHVVTTYCCSAAASLRHDQHMTGNRRVTLQ